MHQLAAYIKEREGFDSVITEHGFATYKIQGEECYIRDIWVNPDFRKTRVASDIADSIAAKAKEAGCTYLTGSVDALGANPTTSVKVLLAYGFLIHSAIPNGIIFKKEI